MTIATLLRTAPGKTAIAASIALSLSLGFLNSTYAGPREQARRIHDRLTGVPPTNSELAAMTDCITNGVASSACTTAANSNGIAGISSDGKVMATYLAMQNPNFLNVVVKNMVIPWTNKDQTVFAPLNDAAATVIGLIRDGATKDFREVLYGDIIYTGNDNSLPAYSNSNNNHYIQMEHRNLNLRTVLQAQPQTSVTGHPLEAVAGVLTTRQSARAFFYAGTNRAMFRFTMMNYLCSDLEPIKDITRVPDRIHQDVSRSPGGDSSIFLNNCIGCHAGMDGMLGAFAYYNWGPAVFDPNADPETQSMTYVQSPNTYTLSGKSFTSRVVPKFVQNFPNFPYGYFTTDNSWINYWRTGPNAKLGWAGNTPQAPSTGTGAAALGQELANSEAFARCQVIKVYRQVCFNDPTESTLGTIVTDFKNSNYNMLKVFSDAAINCSDNLNP
jgi:hypothetical protein